MGDRIFLLISGVIFDFLFWHIFLRLSGVSRHGGKAAGWLYKSAVLWFSTSAWLGSRSACRPGGVQAQQVGRFTLTCGLWCRTAKNKRGFRKKNALLANKQGHMDCV